MAQFREWIHTVHTELDTKSYANMSSYGYGNPASWTSEEDDTESESEQSFRSFECRRKKTCAMRQKTRMPVQPAAPLLIPARTHDFGWCDRDDARTQSTVCPCGNDCAEFFSDDSQPASCTSSFSPSACASPREETCDDEDFMFDMEM